MHKHHPMLRQEFLLLDNEYQLKLNKVLELLTNGVKMTAKLVDYDDPKNLAIDPTNKQAASFMDTKDTLTNKFKKREDNGEWYGEMAEDEIHIDTNQVVEEQIEETQASTTTEETRDINHIPVPMKTMIFTNTVMEAKYLVQDLIFNGIRAVPYHKEMSMKDRNFALEAFRASERTQANVMVCTDLASRGIDVPDVEHVIQFDFATNVVMHLHRIGRAVRGGRKGKATNFYGNMNKDLVDSIQLAGDEKNGELDQTFSRQRGFRKKIKKYGRTYYGLATEVEGL